MTSVFVDRSPQYFDPIFSVSDRFEASKNPKKVILGVGVYKNSQGQSFVLDVVKKVEAEMVKNPPPNKDYLPICGNQNFVRGTIRLLFGEVQNHNLYIQGVQTLSGTGALRLAFEFLYKYNGVKHFYHSFPTWPIHTSIVHFLEIKDARTYSYYNFSASDLAWDAMMACLDSAEKGSVIALQLCGHNPTGMDPTVEQWDVICQKLIEKELVPLFDVAYLGLASGCFETDAYPIRLLSSRGKEMIICVSFSKNMGLYNERVGVLLWCSIDKEASDMVKNRLTVMIRNMYSSPPNHGASVAEKILNNEKYFEEWKTEVESMYKRISEMRSGLAKRLLELKTPGDWSFLTRQRGLFSYTGLNKEQIEYMEKEHGIFMPTSGRINVSGLTVECLDHVAKAIHDAATRFPKHLNK